MGEVKHAQIRRGMVIINWLLVPGAVRSIKNRNGPQVDKMVQWKRSVDFPRASLLRKVLGVSRLESDLGRAVDILLA